MIGQQVRAYRKQRGWKQQQLADALHTSQSVVSEIENGARANLTLEMLDRLADVLNISLRDLLFGPAPDGVDFPGTEDFPPIIATAIRRVGRYLSPRDQERGAAYLEGLAAERMETAGLAPREDMAQPAERQEEQPRQASA